MQPPTNNRAMAERPATARGVGLKGSSMRMDDPRQVASSVTGLLQSKRFILTPRSALRAFS